MPTTLTTALPLDRSLDLVSDTLVSSYHFSATGRVTATIGEKNGPMAAPLFSYRAVSEDTIDILHGNDRIERWNRIRIEGDLLHVERDGQPQIFTLRKPAA